MRIVKCVLLSFYLIFVVLITALLFTFNRFSDSVIGKKTIADIQDNISEYKKGDLLIVSKVQDIVAGDEILFYDTSNTKNFLNCEKVVKVIDTNNSETTYVIRDNEFVSSSYVIGSSKNCIRLPFLGYLYSLFTSKLGYLFFVIIPIVIYFIFLLKKYKHDKKKN